MRTHSLFSLSCLSVLALTASLMTSTPVWAADTAQEIKSEKLNPVDTLDAPTSLSVMVHRSVPLHFKRPASSIFIANPEIADIQVLSPTSIMVYGKKEGQTTLQVADDTGRNLVYKTVFVTQNLATLRKALRTALPGSNIQVESLPDGLIMTGSVSDPSAIEDARRLASRYIPKDGDIINRIKVQANNQVEIRVRFAEVSRNVDKRFGFNWNNITTIGGIAFSLASGNVFSGAGTLAASRTVNGDGVNDSLGLSYSKGDTTLNGLIDALAKNNLVTILAEPSLTAMSGQTASFLAGGEFPVPIPQSGDTITIEWKQYGVSLAFTPTVVNGNRINLHVRPEVSQLSETGGIDLNGYDVPALTTRRAETTIELNSGQSFALAGLLNNQQTQSVSKYPFLGDLPILGPLFRSTRFQNDETELVIIITPYIVKPATQEQLALPTDGFSPPTDTDMYFRMRETNSDPKARPISGESRAITIENPSLQELPAPAKAPRIGVTHQPAVETKAAPTPVSRKAPMSKPMSISKNKAPAPLGPGGFIVE